MKKRIFSFLLALCLLSGNCLTVFADETEPASQESSTETVIAEKMHAIIDLADQSSRMKDYYDIYHLLTSFKYDNTILQEARRFKCLELRLNAEIRQQKKKPRAAASYLPNWRKVASYRSTKTFFAKRRSAQACVTTRS